MTFFDKDSPSLRRGALREHFKQDWESDVAEMADRERIPFRFALLNSLDATYLCGLR
jgi:hypothetical protein